MISRTHTHTDTTTQNTHPHTLVPQDASTAFDVAGRHPMAVRDRVLPRFFVAELADPIAAKPLASALADALQPPVLPQLTAAERAEATKSDKVQDQLHRALARKKAGVRNRIHANLSSIPKDGFVRAEAHG